MPTVKTVDRAIDLLECFSAERPELGVGDLATLLGIDKSGASRMAATLRERRFLQMDKTSRRYRIGARMHELARLFDRRESLSQIAVPQLRALVREVAHASHVGVLDGPDVLIVACVESEQQLQVAVQVGERRALHATAAGKLFLAFGADNLLQDLSNGGRLPMVGPKTIDTVTKMNRELASVRREGMAYNREESARGVGAVAAPIYGADKTIAASLTTIFPLALVDQAEWVRIGNHVRRTADRISALLVSA
ncbi:MAG: IclR family transcriptional regulator [Burkholderiales bacterium]|nr:MAG: IclR family transcriptional regulator [Burkholderiales bacterium]